MGKTSYEFKLRRFPHMNIDLTAEEINVLLESAQNCLNTCKEGGTDHHCPDCEKLQSIMAKLQAGVKG